MKPEFVLTPSPGRGRSGLSYGKVTQKADGSPPHLGDAYWIAVRRSRLLSAPGISRPVARARWWLIGLAIAPQVWNDDPVALGQTRYLLALKRGETVQQHRRTVTGLNEVLLDPVGLDRLPGDAANGRREVLRGGG